MFYIVGNPPFVGSRLMTDKQKIDLKKIFGSEKIVVNWIMFHAGFIKQANI